MEVMRMVRTWFWRAVIAAAVTHAAWNAIAHGIKDQTLAFALIGVGGIAVGIPLGIVNFKIIPVTLVPLGVRIVPTSARYASRGTGYQY